jgi:putative transposase
MARIARMMISGEPAVYHVMSRTALDGFPFGDVEKDFFVDLVKRFSGLYFTEVLGFCCMGNHFYLLVRMLPETDFSDRQVMQRYERFSGKEEDFAEGQIPWLRQRLSSLSEFVKDIKLGFSRFYNKRHNRRGFFWGDRFKSVIVENGETLINCLAYIDLNPVRAGIVERPEDYRWSSIGYHVQTGNKDNFFSLDFGLKEFGVMDAGERLRRYRRFVYEAGAIDAGKGVQIDPQVLEKERENAFNLDRAARFKYRTRYFTDSGIIGTKAFVTSHYQRFKHLFQSKRDKVPRRVDGLGGIYSLKRLENSEQ